MKIAHFRVAVSLRTTIQMEISGVFSCKSNSLSFEWLSTKTHFEPEAQTVTRKCPDPEPTA